MRSPRFMMSMPAAAQALAQELGRQAAGGIEARSPSCRTSILTVVTDDKAMKSIYNGGLLQPRAGQAVHQLRHRHARRCTCGWKQKAEKTGAQSP